MAELDVNEGIVPLIEMRFPPPGTMLTPIFPTPTNARTFVILRLLGVLAGVVAKGVDGRMPADRETIRNTGVLRRGHGGRSYLMREVRGGGSGGRYYADGEDTIHGGVLRSWPGYAWDTPPRPGESGRPRSTSCRAIGLSLNLKDRGRWPRTCSNP